MHEKTDNLSSGKRAPIESRTKMKIFAYAYLGLSHGQPGVLYDCTSKRKRYVACQSHVCSPCICSLAVTCLNIDAK